MKYAIMTAIFMFGLVSGSSFRGVTNTSNTHTVTLQNAESFEIILPLDSIPNQTQTLANNIRRAKQNGASYTFTIKKINKELIYVTLDFVENKNEISSIYVANKPNDADKRIVTEILVEAGKKIGNNLGNSLKTKAEDTGSYLTQPKPAQSQGATNTSQPRRQGSNVSTSSRRSR